MNRWTKVILVAFVIMMMPLASANTFWRSTDTSYHDGREVSLVVYHDYWNNRVSHYADEGSFDMTVKVPEGNYSWTFPASISVTGEDAERHTLTNPALLLFEEFRVTSHKEGAKGGIASVPGQLSTSTSMEDYRIHNFTLTYKLKDLTPAERLDLDEIVYNNNAEMNRQAHNDEVFVGLNFKQVLSEEERAFCESQSQDGICKVLVELRFQMFYNLAHNAQDITYEPPRESTDVITGTCKTVKGLSYQSEQSTLVKADVTGDLGEKASVEFFIDNTQTPATHVMTSRGNAAPTTNEAVYLPSLGPLHIMLPSGSHQVLYKVCSGDIPPILGSVVLDDERGHVYHETKIRFGAPPSPVWIVPVVSAAAGLGVLGGLGFLVKTGKIPVKNVFHRKSSVKTPNAGPSVDDEDVLL